MGYFWEALELIDPFALWAGQSLAKSPGAGSPEKAKARAPREGDAAEEGEWQDEAEMGEVAENIVCRVECEFFSPGCQRPCRPWIFLLLATLNTQPHFGKRRALSDLAKQF
jgi:hypothetical protein